MSVFKCGTKWAFTGGTERYETEKDASIAERRHNRQNTTERVVPESTDSGLFGFTKRKTSTATDSDDKRAEQPEVSVRSGSPSETSG